MTPIARPRSLRFLAVTALVASTSCSGAGRRETAALLRAVEVYRRADDASRARRAEAIFAVACSSTDICAAKDACFAAADATTRALRLKDDVASRVVEIDQKRLSPDSGEAAALPAQLDEAQRLLDTGRQRMSDCERRLGQLRVQYGG